MNATERPPGHDTEADDEATEDPDDVEVVETHSAERVDPKDVAEQLRSLNTMRVDGVISEEEFARRKAELFAR